jgi:NADPH-dependent ferric siderophore reductase
MTTANPSGLLATAFHKLLARRVQVRAVEAVGERFRLVTLAGENLEDCRWTPGDIIQIAFVGWAGRAYTPLSFDPRAGTITVLGYVHGTGTGSEWLASATVGEWRFIVGPRAAVNLNAMRRPATFFGDETSFSTAAALAATPSGYRDIKFVLEVSSLGESRAVLERLGLFDAVTLVAREEGDLHVEKIERALIETYGATGAAQGLFTGKASSIRRLYKGLRAAGVPGRHLTNVAYWAPGRTGFSGVQR